eukprot:CAMPEP_0183341582 /NCGR_PEP_ID=MMETSP0164_2-20130417/7813_1 /TAXON_ID=221442 /ORGANISM="Coccolithus pelagicus ssp braarudi, Strain PLY182g" /LENGTH=338 /DNA_ID=CAMNT_0025511945 /DNA_START=39 /DNA_END=1055 /DNA_ORIENTATION=-
MPIKVLLWQGPSSTDDLKKPSPHAAAFSSSTSALLKRLVTVSLVLLGSAFAASTLFVLHERELEKQPRLEMHSVPMSELIHTADLNYDLSLVVASKTQPSPHGTPPPSRSSPPPPSPLPPGSPASPPPSPRPPYWVIDSLLPPRPVNAGARYNDTTDAYLVQDARPGTILIGGKGLAAPYKFLEGATVLLLAVCHHQPSIFGVVLNHMMNESMDGAFCPSSRAKYPNFVNSTVRYGGPNAPHWTVLARASSPGAHAVVPGLFAGGSLLDLNRQVARGQTVRDSVAFYSGYVAWQLADLKKQIENGDWLVAQAPASLLLKTPSASNGTQFTAALTAALK